MMGQDDTVELDGSYLEGGGQILRTAVGLSAVTGRPCRIFNIRKGRRNPGLRAQHLCGIQAVGTLCGAELVGAQVGSTVLEFRPGRLEPPESLCPSVGTAGAVTLVLQALLIPLAFSPRPVTIRITGGTHVRWSPPVDYAQHVLSRFLGRMDCELELTTERYGFYPRGGGRVRAVVRPGSLRPAQWLERGELKKVMAWSIATEDLKAARVAERQIEGARELLQPDDESSLYVRSPSSGTAIFLLAECSGTVLGASALGERGKPAEKVGRECAQFMIEEIRSGACLDRYMADQILPFMALAPEECRVSVADITGHCRTNIWVIEQFLPVSFDVDEEQRAIRCRRRES